MADQESFEVSPNKIEAKGRIRGVTRISKKAKLLASVVLGALLLLVTVATYKGFNANKHQEGQAAATADDKQSNQAAARGITSANFDDHMKGVGDGQAALAALDADAAASGVPVIGPVSPSMPGNTLPGTGVAIAGSSGGDLVPSGKSKPKLDLGASSSQRPGQTADLSAGGSGGGMRGPGRTQEEVSSEKLHSAIDSGINVEFDTSSRDMPKPGDNTSAGASALRDGVAALSQAAAGAGGGRLIATSDDPNKQIRKEQFLKEAEAQPDKSYLKEVVQPEMSKFEIAIGWAIPASLGCGANTDLPGQLCAIVRENVCDSATG
jgi:hypothetical protein